MCNRRDHVDEHARIRGGSIRAADMVMDTINLGCNFMSLGRGGIHCMAQALRRDSARHT
jgi:arginine deiminase